MKRNIILAALISTFVFAAASYAQPVSLSLTDSPTTNLVMVKAIFPTAYSGGVRVLEGELPATTQAACLASTDFSRALPMDPARFQINFNAETSTYYFSFAVDRETFGCRVVRFAGGVDAHDFLLWQKGGSPSSSGMAEELKNGSSDARGGDGSVRLVRYTIAANY
jgi:hypothetical protein